MLAPAAILFSVGERGQQLWVVVCVCLETAKKLPPLNVTEHVSLLLVHPTHVAEQHLLPMARV